MNTKIETLKRLAPERASHFAGKLALALRKVERMEADLAKARQSRDSVISAVGCAIVVARKDAARPASKDRAVAAFRSAYPAAIGPTALGHAIGVSCERARQLTHKLARAGTVAWVECENGKGWVYAGAESKPDAAAYLSAVAGQIEGGQVAAAEWDRQVRLLERLKGEAAAAEVREAKREREKRDAAEARRREQYAEDDRLRVAAAKDLADARQAQLAEQSRLVARSLANRGVRYRAARHGPYGPFSAKITDDMTVSQIVLSFGWGWYWLIPVEAERAKAWGGAQLVPILEPIAAAEAPRG